jgi:hypothetical protein
MELNIEEGPDRRLEIHADAYPALKLDLPITLVDGLGRIDRSRRPQTHIQSWRTDSRIDLRVESERFQHGRRTGGPQNLGGNPELLSQKRLQSRE